MSPAQTRELTSAERAFLDRIRRRRAVFTCMTALVMYGAFVGTMVGLGGLTSELPEFRRSTLGLIVFLTLICGGLVYFGAFRPPPWLPAKGRYARVGRITGLYYTGGKPINEYVGAYPVQAPAELKLPRDSVVEVEVCPAVEDYPSKRLARIVLSSADGRVTVDGLMREGRKPSLTYGV